eukprot:886785-Amphidinium_carterae.1
MENLASCETWLLARSLGVHAHAPHDVASWVKAHFFDGGCATYVFAQAAVVWTASFVIAVQADVLSIVQDASILRVSVIFVFP